MSATIARIRSITSSSWSRRPCRCRRDTREILIADPLEINPLSRSRYYAVNVQRLIGAILLGIMTYDANLLVIEPKSDDR